MRMTMSTAGMILGIVAVLFGCIPIIGVGALAFSMVGIVLSGVGMSWNRREGAGIGRALTGLILNIVALMLGIMWLGIMLIVVSVERN